MKFMVFWVVTTQFLKILKNMPSANSIWPPLRKQMRKQNSQADIENEIKIGFVFVEVPTQFGSANPNADLRHLLDSLVSALAVYATVFRS